MSPPQDLPGRPFSQPRSHNHITAERAFEESRRAPDQHPHHTLQHQHQQQHPHHDKVPARPKTSLSHHQHSMPNAFVKRQGQARFIPSSTSAQAPATATAPTTILNVEPRSRPIKNPAFSATTGQLGVGVGRSYDRGPAQVRPAELGNVRARVEDSDDIDDSTVDSKMRNGIKGKTGIAGDAYHYHDRNDEEGQQDYNRANDLPRPASDGKGNDRQFLPVQRSTPSEARQPFNVTRANQIPITEPNVSIPLRSPDVRPVHQQQSLVYGSSRSNTEKTTLPETSVGMRPTAVQKMVEVDEERRNEKSSQKVDEGNIAVFHSPSQLERTAAPDATGSIRKAPASSHIDHADTSRFVQPTSRDYFIHAFPSLGWLYDLLSSLSIRVPLRWDHKQGVNGNQEPDTSIVEQREDTVLARADLIYVQPYEVIDRQDALKGRAYCGVEGVVNGSKDNGIGGAIESDTSGDSISAHSDDKHQHHREHSSVTSQVPENDTQATLHLDFVPETQADNQWDQGDDQSTSTGPSHVPVPEMIVVPERQMHQRARQPRSPRPPQAQFTTTFHPGRFEVILHLHTPTAELRVERSHWSASFSGTAEEEYVGAHLRTIFDLLDSAGRLRIVSETSGGRSTTKLLLINHDENGSSSDYAFDPLPGYTDEPRWSDDLRRGVRQKVHQQMQRDARVPTRQKSRHVIKRLRDSAYECDQAYKRYRKRLADNDETRKERERVENALQDMVHMLENDAEERINRIIA